MLNALVLLQIITFVVISGVFFYHDDWRLAVAQLAYALATGVIFFQ
jgi:hypothetical protein